MTFDSEKLLAELMSWVEIDTPTGDIAGISRLIDLIEQSLAPLGAQVERIAGRAGMGDHLIARFAGGDGPGVFLTSHIDTVCPPGAVAIRREGTRQYGPGIADMKSGAFLALAAVRSLIQEGRPLAGPVTLMWNSDEEIGSPTSHDIIASLAQTHGAALIPEPARGDEVITFRKGRGKYRLEAFGQESHAGSAFGAGENAIYELAYQLTKIEALSDLSAGITVNVGRIFGGTEPNVVAGYAAADLDLRFKCDEQSQQVEAALKNLRAKNPAVTLKLTGEVEKPALARNAQTLALLALAQKVNGELGYDLVETASGGGSDGNYTSAAGVATLDGLGGIGNDWHSPNEFIDVPSLARRAELLKHLIDHLAGHRLLAQEDML